MRQPSAETENKRLRSEAKSLRTENARLTNINKLLSTHNERLQNEVTEWKLRFDLLLRRTPTIEPSEEHKS